MKLRRIVTGTNDKGESYFASDAIAPVAADFKHTPGFALSVVWATKAGGAASSVDPTPSLSSVVPGLGETRLMLITFPPDSVMADPAFNPQEAGKEFAQHLPGLAETFEMESPGMHRTQTVDYGIVLDGELWLELDNAQTRAVKKGDIVIQNGTRHAWRNPGTRPATVAFVLIGR